MKLGQKRGCVFLAPHWIRQWGVWFHFFPVIKKKETFSFLKDRFVGKKTPSKFLSLYYRPQRSCGKVMFSHVFVILFTGGVCSSACWDTHPPGPKAEPPRDQKQTLQDQRQTPPQDQKQAPPGTKGRWLLLRTVRILASYWNAFLL